MTNDWPDSNSDWMPCGRGRPTRCWGRGTAGAGGWWCSAWAGKASCCCLVAYCHYLWLYSWDPDTVPTTHWFASCFVLLELLTREPRTQVQTMFTTIVVVTSFMIRWPASLLSSTWQDSPSNISGVRYRMLAVCWELLAAGVSDWRRSDWPPPSSQDPSQSGFAGSTSSSNQSNISIN